MRIIDTHNHIWHCKGEHFSWITEGLATIRRDFLIDDLLAVLDEHQVTGGMLVQAVPTLAESEWLLEMAEQTDKIQGGIGWADITKGRAVTVDLRRLMVKSSRLKGIRYMSQGLPGEHLLTQEFIEGVRCVGEQGLVYELLINAQQLDAADRLIAACPDVVFVIEHMAKPAIRAGEIEPWRSRLQQIGQRHPNVFCKLSGMTTEADYQRWSGVEQAYQQTKPYIAAVFSAFGEDRVMFGSDWPVSLLALPYAGVLALCPGNSFYIEDAMKIIKAEIFMVDLKPKVKRVDAIQSFVSQETPIVRLTTASGAVGEGYTYTIGTGGSSVVALLRDHLLPALIGREATMIEAIWESLLFSTHATSVGAITSLALAAIDTALWDLKCKQMNLPLYKVAGGAKARMKLYTTEGGWLHLSTQELVDDALAVKAQGFCGSKIKIGSESPVRDIERLQAVRKAVGNEYVIMTDCNQAFKFSEGKQRAALLEHVNLSWIEEPFLAQDVDSHKKLCESTTIPVAVGESIYSIQHFKEYLQNNAADIIQVDVARIGGITPWLKVAHMAECFNKIVCPHFLMELHISLCCAITNSRWLEYIPQLDGITLSKVNITEGFAYPPETPGLGIHWDWQKINQQTLVHHIIE